MGLLAAFVQGDKSPCPPPALLSDLLSLLKRELPSVSTFVKTQSDDPVRIGRTATNRDAQKNRHTKAVFFRPKKRYSPRLCVQLEIGA